MFTLPKCRFSGLSISRKAILPTDDYTGFCTIRANIPRSFMRYTQTAGQHQAVRLLRSVILLSARRRNDLCGNQAIS